MTVAPAPPATIAPVPQDPNAPVVGQMSMADLIAYLTGSMPQAQLPTGAADPLSQAYLQSATQRGIAALQQAGTLAQSQQANQIKTAELMGADPTGAPTDAASQWRAKLAADQAVQDETLRQRQIQTLGYDPSDPNQQTLEARTAAAAQAAKMTELLGFDPSGNSTLAAQSLAQQTQSARAAQAAKMAELLGYDANGNSTLAAQSLAQTGQQAELERQLKQALQSGQLNQQEAEFARTYLLQQDASKRQQADTMGYDEQGNLTESGRKNRADEVTQRAQLAAQLMNSPKDVFKAGAYFRQLDAEDPTGLGLQGTGISGFTGQAQRMRGAPGTVSVDQLLGNLTGDSPYKAPTLDPSRPTPAGMPQLPVSWPSAAATPSSPLVGGPAATTPAVSPVIGHFPTPPPLPAAIPVPSGGPGAGTPGGPAPWTVPGMHTYPGAPAAPGTPGSLVPAEGPIPGRGFDPSTWNEATRQAAAAWNAAHPGQTANGSQTGFAAASAAPAAPTAPDPSATASAGVMGAPSAAADSASPSWLGTDTTKKASGTEPGGPVGIGAGGMLAGRKAPGGSPSIDEMLADIVKLGKSTKGGQAPKTKNRQAKPIAHKEPEHPSNPLKAKAAIDGLIAMKRAGALPPSAPQMGMPVPPMAQAGLPAPHGIPDGLPPIMAPHAPPHVHLPHPGAQPGGPVDAPLWPTAGSATSPMPVLQSAGSLGAAASPSAGGAAAASPSATSDFSSMLGLAAPTADASPMTAGGRSTLDQYGDAFNDQLLQYGVQGMGGLQADARMSDTQSQLLEAELGRLGLSKADWDKARAQRAWANTGSALSA